MAIEHESLRAVIDPAFRALRDELRLSYYGPIVDGRRQKIGWIAGNSIPFRGFDVQATPELSQALYDKIYGNLWHFYTLVLHDENVTQGMPYDREGYDGTIRDRSYELILQNAQREGRALTNDDVRAINAALTSTEPNTLMQKRRQTLRALRDGLDAAIWSMLAAWAAGEGFDSNVNRTD